jgi:hypothetical protein
MKLAIVGSREFTNYSMAFDILSQIHDVNLIISGGAKGADTIAERFAESRHIPILIIKPEWNIYGKRAGFIRNTTIVNECDKLIAFWNGSSKGTQHSIDLAIKQVKLLSVHIG